jgi:hypothetical protein
MNAALLIMFFFPPATSSTGWLVPYTWRHHMGGAGKCPPPGKNS